MAVRCLCGLSSLPLVVTGFVPAEDDLAFFLGLFFQQVGSAAIRAGLADGTVVGGEAAFRVAAAAVEGATPPALALHHRPLAALRAGEPDLAGLLLLDVLAIGIAAAGDEGAEPAATPG